ncbi:MAG: polyprenyl synthetase family protein [Rickettsiales bacterium]
MNAPARSPSKPADLNALRELVASDLNNVNRVIIDYSHSPIALINDMTEHIVAAGGKRLRPSLTIAAAKLCGYVGERHVRLAACVEFIHTATLLHDDVVDASDLRRGTATANAVWGNKSSVLVGDFLFSRAFQLMVTDGSLDVLKILSDASAIIAAGEVHQLMVSHDLAITQEVYEQVISAKTAALFAAACELGAVVGDKPEWRDALRSYGQNLGMAFQVVDDALDYQASQSDIGKAIGDDLRDGKVTLPVIFAYAKASDAERTFWQSTLEAGDAIEDDALRRAKELLMKHDAFGLTLKVAQTFANAACESLKQIPDSQTKQALIDAAHFSVERSY